MDRQYCGYIINGMSILNQVGEVISTAPQINENFNVKIEVNKIKSNDINGYIILAVYDMKGGLLNIDCAEANFDTNSDYASCDFSIPAQRAEIDSIRAFIWSGVNSMNPLAETKTIYFTN